MSPMSLPASASNHPLLSAVLWPEGRINAYLRLAVLALAGTALLTLSAKLKVPFYPVPMTMQTLVVLLLGAVYGPRLGMATIVLYLAEGALGLPVFSGTPEKGIGIAYMMGPTGGYLAGFVLAAGLVGFLAKRGFDRSPPRMALALGLGNALIYAPGLLWLGAMAGWDKPVLEWGLYPFLMGDALKLLLGAALLPSIWTALSRYRADH